MKDWLNWNVVGVELGKKTITNNPEFMKIKNYFLFECMKGQHNHSTTFHSTKSNKIQRNPNWAVQIEISPSNSLVLDFVGFRWLHAALFWISLDFVRSPLQEK